MCVYKVAIDPSCLLKYFFPVLAHTVGFCCRLKKKNNHVMTNYCTCLHFAVELLQYGSYISFLSFTMILKCLEGTYVTYTSEIFSDPRRKKKVFVEQYLGLFLPKLGLFCHFVPGLLTIALSSRLPLFIWIAGIGLGTRLVSHGFWCKQTRKFGHSSIRQSNLWVNHSSSLTKTCFWYL